MVIVITVILAFHDSRISGSVGCRRDGKPVGHYPSIVIFYILAPLAVTHCQHPSPYRDPAASLNSTPTLVHCSLTKAYLQVPLLPSVLCLGRQATSKDLPSNTKVATCVSPTLNFYTPRKQSTRHISSSSIIPRSSIITGALRQRTTATASVTCRNCCSLLGLQDGYPGPDVAHTGERCRGHRRPGTRPQRSGGE